MISGFTELIGLTNWKHDEIYCPYRKNDKDDDNGDINRGERAIERVL